jgi:hypothetical protein
MKKALVLVSMLALAGSTLGQGYVNFINYNPSQNVNGLVTRSAETGGAAAGDTIYGQLWAGAPGASLAPVGQPELFRNNASTGAPTGVISGGVVEIPGIAAGGAADLQLKSWTASAGTDFDVAMGTIGAEWGESNVISLGATGDGGVVTPAFLAGLQATTMSLVVPEPSTWALMALGLGALALRRRK